MVKKYFLIIAITILLVVFGLLNVLAVIFNVYGEKILITFIGIFIESLIVFGLSIFFTGIIILLYTLWDERWVKIIIALTAYGSIWLYGSVYLVSDTFFATPFGVFITYILMPMWFIIIFILGIGIAAITWTTMESKWTNRISAKLFFITFIVGNYALAWIFFEFMT